MNKVKDYARNRKLDSSAKEKMQHGGDPMDVGVVGGHGWEEQYYDQGSVYAIGFQGAGRGAGGNGQGESYNCGATGHFSRECPHPNKGKSKCTGF